MRVWPANFKCKKKYYLAFKTIENNVCMIKGADLFRLPQKKSETIKKSI